MIRPWFRYAAPALLALLSACSGQRLETAPSVTEANPYRLGAGDALRLIVFGEDRMSGEFRVGDNGTVALPLIGEIKAAGQTIDELTQAITAAYANNFLKNPRVAVEILNYRPFFILGQVAKPGQYPFMPGMTVMQAIATANGYTPAAKQKIVMITHWGEKEEKTYRVNAAMVVRPGDTIRIPERLF